MNRPGNYRQGTRSGRQGGLPRNPRAGGVPFGSRAPRTGQMPSSSRNGFDSSIGASRWAGGGNMPPQYANNRNRTMMGLDAVANGVGTAKVWASDNPPFKCGLFAMAFIEACLIVMFLVTGAMWYGKASHSFWATPTEFTLSNLEKDLLQDPEAHVYSWWCIMSGVLMMVMGLYLMFMFAVYSHKRKLKIFEKLREKAKEHAIKVAARKQKDVVYHMEMAQKAGMGVQAAEGETGEYWVGQAEGQSHPEDRVEEGMGMNSRYQR